MTGEATKTTLMNIQLQTGNTITMSCYEYFFVLKDEDVEAFYQACIADNLGIEINDPWSGRSSMGRIEYDETPEQDSPED
jgi:hypothetical protein